MLLKQNKWTKLKRYRIEGDVVLRKDKTGSRTKLQVCLGSQDLQRKWGQAVFSWCGVQDSRRGRVWGDNSAYTDHGVPCWRTKHGGVGQCGGSRECRPGKRGSKKTEPRGAIQLPDEAGVLRIGEPRLPEGEGHELNPERAEKKENWL